jgi:hypothetical protein
MSDLSDPLTVKKGSKTKRVAFLSDLVDGSDEMDGSSLKENEAKEIVEKIENHIKNKEGMKGVLNEHIQESVSKIRDKIYGEGYQYRPNLDDEYSQNSALTFKSVSKIREKIYGEGYQYRPGLDDYSQHSALTFKDSGMSQVKLLACLGFDSLFIEDDSWSCDSSTNVPMGLGTFTYEDDFEL